MCLNEKKQTNKQTNSCDTKYIILIHVGNQKASLGLRADLID